jgi:hypothetical protein
MQLMGLERIIRVGGIDIAHTQPLAAPALDAPHLAAGNCEGSV